MCFRFRSFPFQSAFFRPPLFRFWLLSLCFFLSSFFPSPPHSSFLGAPSPLSLPRFPLSLRPDFSCLPSRFLYSALLMVSFRPSLIRSHSCSSGACLLLRFLASPYFPAFSVPLPLPFVRFCFPSGYSAFCFFLSVLPASASQRLLRCPSSAFASYVSPFSPAWFPVHSFPVPVLSLAVCFLSPFLASLPQLFHECLPDLSFRHFPFRFCFLSSASTFLPATQLSVSSFPFFRFLPHSGFFRAASPLSLPGFPRSLPPDFSCVPSRFPYSALLMVSFRPSLLRSRSCSTGDPLLSFLSGADA